MEYITNPFNDYGYIPQEKWIGAKAQLEAQGVETEYYVEFGKGFVAGSPEPSPTPRKPKYLTFTANEDESAVAFVYYFYAPEGTEPPVFNIQYRLGEDEEWQEYEARNFDDGEEPMWISLNAGESVQFKGINPDGFYHYEELPDENVIEYGMYCLMDGLISASGDITSILNGVGGDCPLPEGCYSSMFGNCTSLETAPELPATTLANNCYTGMFNGCSSLTTAPELPATTLSESCYALMFSGCTSLTTAPELPATTLAESCYSYMFQGCTSLNSVTCLATDISASSCTNWWLHNVAQTGTFYKAASMDDWTEGVSGIPSGWTVESVS